MVQLILRSLPARFNDGKISLKVSMRHYFFDLDKFMYWIEAFKKELIFDQFSVSLSSNRPTLQECINGIMLLFTRCKQLHLKGIYSKTCNFVQCNNYTSIVKRVELEDSNIQLNSALQTDKFILPKDGYLSLKRSPMPEYINLEQLQSLDLCFALVH